MDHWLEIIQHGIADRQRELHNAADALANAAKRKGRQAAFGKVTTIVLGAFIATQAVAAQLWGDGNHLVLVTYSLAGLLVATVGGIEAAFKFDSRSAELSALAAQCQSMIWQIDSEWSKSVGTATGEAQLQAARGLLDRQDKALSDVQSRAAQAGENITLDLRELYGAEPPALA